ncbi:MAG: tRNA (N(6)-L-threonylcarbamoyladenosine(37)-C(2))-methylthiotransferase MtaB [Selenomonadaceae bacterium]|nr:tRNA (N(6)-L-threonylcarbamoyladenosine(37)-C(2))-methylthiotransferase MtaB [Selenomonadaceae bacterium]
MPTVALATLGCKVNQFETETVEGLFRQRGYEVVPFSEAADVYVINTCSVTSLGDSKSRQLIRRARRQNDAAIIAVTGCYAQVSPEEIKALDGVRVVLGTKDRAKIVDYVEQAAREDGLLDGVADVMEQGEFEDIPLFGMPTRTRAFLKIEDGCQNFCSYCIIPYARGPVKSRQLSHIRREAEKLAGAGFKEIVLTGIHLGAYGKDLPGNVTLADACREVLAVSGLKRLRLGSLESIELSPELFALMREEKERFCAHLHLPMQAGSDAILKAMNRHYDTAEFGRLIQRVEQEIPGIAISTDVIVGFPGETEELFQESLDFAERMNFSRMHVFPYSRRKGTPAASMPGQVPEPVKKERVHRMQALAKRKAEEFHQGFLGRKMRVLFETSHEGIADGLTDNYIRVYADGDGAELGEIFMVSLEKLYKDGVWGRIFPSEGE